MSRREDGFFLVSAIVITLFLTAVGLSVATLTAQQYQHTKREMFTENAQLLAEAGIEQSAPDEARAVQLSMTITQVKGGEPVSATYTTRMVFRNE